MYILKNVKMLVQTGSGLFCRGFFFMLNVILRSPGYFDTRCITLMRIFNVLFYEINK